MRKIELSESAGRVRPDQSDALLDGRRNFLDYEWLSFLPMGIVHIVPFVALALGWYSVKLFVMMGVFYAFNMFSVTGGYHRYFSHKTYKTSRWFQFVIAWFAQASAQAGALRWAARHRYHHKHSDLPSDVHSPIQHGFWYSHILWVYNHTRQLNKEGIKDLQRFPELVFIDKHYLIPAIGNGVIAFLIGGWPGVALSYCGAIVLSWHITFTINSLCHIWGTRRYPTEDGSRNNPVLALLTFGEGWHNNHHYCMHSARQGFRWWEYDFTYYGLRLLSALGLIWDLRTVPKSAYDPKNMIGGESGEKQAAAA